MKRIKDYLDSKRKDLRKLPDFRSGDTIRVIVKVKEGGKERLQEYEGLVIKKRRGPQASFTVRKISFGVGVERIFPLDTPSIHSIEVVRQGRVRRSKLYYMRERKGKKARIDEKVDYGVPSPDGKAEVEKEVESEESESAAPHAQAVT